jgi:hypothetical protein
MSFGKLTAPVFVQSSLDWIDIEIVLRASA